jgi:hypothetical protein
MPISIGATLVDEFTYDDGVPDRVARSSRGMTREIVFPPESHHPYSHAVKPAMTKARGNSRVKKPMRNPARTRTGKDHSWHRRIRIARIG